MNTDELVHLLRRTEYVAKPDRVAALSGMTRAQAVDDILSVGASPAVPDYLLTDVSGQEYQQFVFATQWWLDRMVDGTRPMQERMTLFWHGHFCSGWDKVFSMKALASQNKVFRDNALGNFRTLARAASLHPALLLYLDNQENVDYSPNQNFARELMELFLLGVGNYTEDDVVASARAWTGHGIDWTTMSYQFHSWDHDAGNKTFMGVTRAWDGPEIIDHILLTNTTTRMTACRFLTRKLWAYLAGDAPSDALVTRLAQVLYDNNLEMLPWVRALLVSDEFYATSARTGLVRSPIDFVVAVMHFTGYRAAALNPQWYLQGMGQQPFLPPNVAGWRTNDYWTNASAFESRGEFARYTTWQLRANNANNIGAGRTADQTVDALAAMFGLQLATPTRAALVDYVNVQRVAEPWVGWWEATNLLTMGMLTPEFHVA